MEASEAATGRRRGRVGNRIERANPGSLCVVRVAEESCRLSHRQLRVPACTGEMTIKRAMRSTYTNQWG
ncbi:hypothetical protein VYU27_008087 [Nannochloropsis oceanica]